MYNADGLDQWKILIRYLYRLANSFESRPHPVYRDLIQRIG